MEARTRIDFEPIKVCDCNGLGALRTSLNSSRHASFYQPESSLSHLAIPFHILSALFISYLHHPLLVIDLSTRLWSTMASSAGFKGLLSLFHYSLVSIKTVNRTLEKKGLRKPLLQLSKTLMFCKQIGYCKILIIRINVI